MTGFKEGASEAPISGGGEDGDPNDDSEGTERVGSGIDRVDHSAGGRGQKTGSDSTLPWIYERSSITSDRSTKQLHLQEETMRQETTFQSQLETELGESVKKADVREAAYLVGMTYLEEVADQLREWGYDHE